MGLGEGSIFMKKLKDIRKEKGLSIRSVAAGLGFNSPFINRVESGQKVSHTKVLDYAHYLDCEIVPLRLGQSWLTTYAGKIITYYFGKGLSLIVDHEKKSIIVVENDKVLKVYDYYIHCGDEDILEIIGGLVDNL